MDKIKACAENISVQAFIGGDSVTRTRYLYVANVPLYQMSYIPIDIMYYKVYFSKCQPLPLIFFKKNIKNQIKKSCLFPGNGV